VFNLSVKVDKEKKVKRKNEKKTSVSHPVFLRIPTDLYEELDRLSFRKKITIQKFIIRILDEYNRQ